MFNNIFEYIDKIMRIVKPKSLVYMAIDGVAPRAKMN
jgi:5'-3' exoribonuclease 2